MGRVDDILDGLRKPMWVPHDAHELFERCQFKGTFHLCRPEACVMCVTETLTKVIGEKKKLQAENERLINESKKT